MISLGLGATSYAAVTYGSVGTAYIQNFDSLGITGTPAWANDNTLPGSYAFHSGATSGSNGIVRNAVDSGSAVMWDTPDTYSTASTYTSSQLTSFGSAGASDRALGAVAGSSGSGSAGDLFYAVVLQNTTGQTLTSVDIAYVGEQWREGRTRTNADTLVFSYKTAPTFDPTLIPTTGSFGDYTLESSLDFASPQFTNAGTDLALDGNATANRAERSATLGVTWNDGEFLVLRWWDDDAAGFDHGISIDDLSVTGNAAVPEPGSAALLGAAALLLASHRRTR